MAINTTTTNGVARIAIDRPDKKNALTSTMYRQMAEAIRAAEGDAAVRAILICGTEIVFTAGNDLQEFASQPSGIDSGAFPFMTTLRDAEKPVVAAVAGNAVGIGTTMLLHCDLVYAADNARFSVPFVSLGLCPEFASSYLLPLRAGHTRAAEKFLLAEPFDAAEAVAMGLVTRIVPTGEVIAYAQARAERFAELPPTSVRITKRLIKQVQRTTIEETMTREHEQFRELLRSPEAREAFAAFFEKRKPDFNRT